MLADPLLVILKCLHCAQSILPSLQSWAGYLQRCLISLSHTALAEVSPDTFSLHWNTTDPFHTESPSRLSEVNHFLFTTLRSTNATLWFVSRHAEGRSWDQVCSHPPGWWGAPWPTCPWLWGSAGGTGPRARSWPCLSPSRQWGNHLQSSCTAPALHWTPPGLQYPELGQKRQKFLITVRDL